MNFSELTYFYIPNILGGILCLFSTNKSTTYNMTCIINAFEDVQGSGNRALYVGVTHVIIL